MADTAVATRGEAQLETYSVESHAVPYSQSQSAPPPPAPLSAAEDGVVSPVNLTTVPRAITLPSSAAASEVASRVPGLPALALAGNFEWAPGSHDTCNYVLPTKTLLAGSYPGDRWEPEHSAKISACLEGANVDCFLCLQERKELERRFTPYVCVARELAASRYYPDRRSLEFWHCPVPDCGVTDDEAFAAAVAAITCLLRRGRTVYVHCWGGHGRTGTVICGFLAQAYGLTVDEAQRYFMAAHSQRRRGIGGGPVWPHSNAQYSQVARLAEQSLPSLEALDARAGNLKPLLDW